MKRTAVVAAILSLTILLGCVAYAADPIVDLAVQSGSGGPLHIPGWHFSRVDLNSGVGGDFIFIGWKRGRETPITRLGFATYTSAQSGPWPDWQWSPSDLNKGAGGHWVYLYWKKDAQYKPVYNMAFIVTGQSSPPPLSGYEAIVVDLNRGADGPYIWPYFTTSPDNGVDAKPKVIDLREGKELKFKREKTRNVKSGVNK